MKKNTLKSLIVFGAFLIFPSGLGLAQNITVAQSSDAADGLDLSRVGELFRDSKDAQEFEKRLNDPQIGVNNLDLDENGEVDYIRVVDEAQKDTHVLILQVQLSKTEFQDVATIEIEKAEADYEIQVHGNVNLYGPNYYLSPPGVNWAAVAFVAWLYRPDYRPYRSPYYFGRYPSWWRPARPVARSVYKSRVVRVAQPVKWNVHKTSRVVTARKVYVKPHSTHLVKKTLRHPTATQKKYQTRRRDKAVSSGGFGRETKKNRKSTKTNSTRKKKKKN